MTGAAGAAGYLDTAARRYAITLAGGSRAVAEGRDLPAAAAAVLALAEQVSAGGPVRPVPGGLPEAGRYQVSVLVEHAMERAQAQHAPVPVQVELAGALKAWDAAAGVTERNPSIRAFIAAGRPAGVQPRDLGA